MNQNINLIYWNSYSAKPYLYGSKVDYIAKDLVFFENELMPAGTVINDWGSIFNYQMTRKTTQLPLLKGDEKYRIKSHITSYPENTYFIRINFYDIYNELISDIVVKDKEYVFLCPGNTYSYNIQLINGGCSSVSFRFIELSKYSENCNFIDNYSVSELLNTDENSTELTVIFTEPQLNISKPIPKKILNKFSDVIVINSVEYAAKLYLQKKCFSQVMEKIKSIENEYTLEKINFVGYGEVSNFAALYYASLFSNSASYITNEFLKLDSYEEIIRNGSDYIEDNIKMLSQKIAANLKNNSDKISIYYNMKEKDGIISALSGCSYKLERCVIKK